MGHVTYTTLRASRPRFDQNAMRLVDFATLLSIAETLQHVFMRALGWF